MRVVLTLAVVVVLILTTLPDGVSGQERPAPLLSTSRVATVGDSDELQLGAARIPSVALTGGGTVAIPTQRNQALAVVREDGGVTTVGRAGDGPGEFRSIERMGATGDGGLWVFDRDAQRFTVFDPSLGYEATRSLFVPEGSLSAGVMARDGSRLLVLQRRVYGERGAEYVVRSHEGTIGEALHSFRVPDARFLVVVGDSDLVGAQPWGLLPRWSHSARRGTLSIAVEESVANRDAGRLTILTFHSESTQMDSIVVELPTRRLGRSEVAERVSSVVSDVSEFASVDPDDVRAAYYVPDRAPLIRGFLAGDDGGFFLALGSDRDGHTWRAVDETGETLFDFSLPAEARLMAASQRRFLVSIMDDFDVPRLYWYELER